MRWRGLLPGPAASTGVTAAAVLILGAVLSPGTEAADVREATMPGDGFAWRLFFTGDTRGYIHPCGCAEGLFGGLPRRATYLAKARKPGDLLIDLGNLIEGTRPHERLKLGYVLEGLKQLEYDVIVPGEGELALGEDFEKAVAGLARPKVVCANLVRAGTKDRIFEPWILHELPDGRTAAVVGLTSPYQTVPARYAVLDPAEALKDALSSPRGKADLIVVAAYLEGKPALDLAAAFASVDVVIAGRVPRGSDALLQRGGAPVIVGGERGQYVSFVGFGDGAKAQAASRGWLGDAVPDTPALADLVKRYDKDASRFGEAFAREAIAAFRTASWVGSAACAECHEAEYAAWEKSKHSHAMAALAEKRQEKNPDCMKCHLQDLPSGGTDAVRGIGCESCHGGGLAHVTALKAGTPHVRASTFKTNVGESCVVCHDEVNSPGFDWMEYWRRIAHGAVRGE